MNGLLLLGFAILSEIVATTALKLSDGFTKPLPSLIVVVGYGIAFYLISLSLRQIPIGTAYAIWSGVGTVATAAIGVLLWKETLEPGRIIGIALIIIGVVVLQAFSKAAA